MKHFKINATLLMLTFLLSTGTAYAKPEINVVASTTFYADIVKKVGGDLVEVKHVANPKFNVHFIQPKPSDIRNVSRADLVVYTGLDLEAWWQPLMEAAGKPSLFPGRHLSVSMAEGVHILDVPDASITRASGDVHIFGNPHIWLGPQNAKTMIGNVSAKLKEIDPANSSIYEKNSTEVLAKLDARIQEWKSICAHCEGQEIISYHEDIRYLAEFIGVKCNVYLEPKPGVPPTPKHLAYLENYVKDKKIKVIVMPTYYPKDAADNLAKKIGAKVITVCQGVGEASGTDDLFAYHDTNIKNIAEALKS